MNALKQALPSGRSAQGFQQFPTLADASRFPCSGNGIQSQGDLSCRCYDCWTGDDCSTQEDIHTCTVDVESGSPLLFEDYWISHPEAEVRVQASYHEGYGTQLPQLERAIRAIHAQVGNAVTDGRSIVIGMGSSQILNAAFFALSNASRSPDVNITKVCSEAPYYNAYKATSQYYGSMAFEWSETTDLEASPDSPVIQVMTAPNNPDGTMRNKTVSGAYGVYDHAYYWPHYTPISQALEYDDRDVAVFTLSKLTGHAGSRIGWAIVKDLDVAQLMMDHVSNSGGDLKVGSAVHPGFGTGSV
ncbi:hypothetical protein WJX84_009171 [Apatococcus fuscideae]|uniref:Alliinase C-terminal domain-containing protein n=1 Tax=Apatococcus fuscideae TaxID=2026836 RepID=A0AAW1SYM6_9CHLO